MTPFATSLLPKPTQRSFTTSSSSEMNSSCWMTDLPLRRSSYPQVGRRINYYEPLLPNPHLGTEGEHQRLVYSAWPSGIHHVSNPSCRIQTDGGGYPIEAAQRTYGKRCGTNWTATWTIWVSFEAEWGRAQIKHRAKTTAAQSKKPTSIKAAPEEKKADRQSEWGRTTIFKEKRSESRRKLLHVLWLQWAHDKYMPPSKEALSKREHYVQSQQKLSSLLWRRHIELVCALVPLPASPKYSCIYLYKLSFFVTVSPTWNKKDAAASGLIFSYSLRGCYLCSWEWTQLHVSHFPTTYILFLTCPIDLRGCYLHLPRHLQWPAHLVVLQLPIKMLNSVKLSLQMKTPSMQISTLTMGTDPFCRLIK